MSHFGLKLSTINKLEINKLSRFPTKPKKSQQKFKYIQNKKSFSSEIKSVFHQF